MAPSTPNGVSINQIYVEGGLLSEPVLQVRTVHVGHGSGSGNSTEFMSGSEVEHKSSSGSMSQNGSNSGSGDGECIVILKITKYFIA